MTAKEQEPTRVVRSEWEHIVPIAVAQDTTSEPVSRGLPPESVAEAQLDTRAVPVNSGSIATRMEVYAYDGAFVGRVKEVGVSDLVVGRRWRTDTRVPLDRVFAVLNERVILTRGGKAIEDPTASDCSPRPRSTRKRRT
jgi:hypothetical protein